MTNEQKLEFFRCKSRFQLIPQSHVKLSDEERKRIVETCVERFEQQAKLCLTSTAETHHFKPGKGLFGIYVDLENMS